VPRQFVLQRNHLAKLVRPKVAILARNGLRKLTICIQKGNRMVARRIHRNNAVPKRRRDVPKVRRAVVLVALDRLPPNVFQRRRLLGAIGLTQHGRQTASLPDLGVRSVALDLGKVRFLIVQQRNRHCCCLVSLTYLLLVTQNKICMCAVILQEHMERIRETFSIVWTGIVHFGQQLKASSTLTKVWGVIFGIVLLLALLMAVVTVWVASTNIFKVVYQQIGDIPKSLTLTGMALQALQAKNASILAAAAAKNRKTIPNPSPSPSPAPTPPISQVANGGPVWGVILSLTFPFAVAAPMLALFVASKRGSLFVMTAKPVLTTTLNDLETRTNDVLTVLDLEGEFKTRQTANTVDDTASQLGDALEQLGNEGRYFADDDLDDVIDAHLSNANDPTFVYEDELNRLYDETLPNERATQPATGFDAFAKAYAKGIEKSMFHYPVPEALV